MRGGLQRAQPTGSRWALLGRAAGLFRPYRAGLAVLVALLTVTTTLDLVGVRLFGSMVDEMTSGTTEGLTSLFLVFLAIVLGSALLGVAQSYVNQVVGQGVMVTLRSDLHAHLQRLPVRFFTQTRTGEILSRVSTDVNAVQQAVTGTFTEFLSSVLALTIALILMFQLNWQLALGTVVVLPLWVYPTIAVGKRMRALMLQWHEESARMTTQLEETLSVSGSMLVKTFGREDHERERFEASNQSLRTLAIRRMMAGRWFNMGTSLFGALVPGVVYWYGGRAVLGGDALSTGDVVAFAMLTQRVFGPFATLARLNTTLLSSAALFERIFEYLDLPTEVDERPDAVTLEAPRGDVAFKDVHFAYVPGGRPALDGVSFEAPRGTMVALVGPSGAGKTTVTYLLQRFYDPQRGAVRIDGHDVRDLTLSSVSATVGAVMQETYLFHASLAENIRYGRLEASDEEVAEAARAAGLWSLVERLPDGLDTVVGERGFRLSGGEKQRVAIARAILKDPPVLVLDEATSSLDSRLEREIREATAILAKGRTTVVIAHRLSTVVAADLILVLDGGRIVERGTHHELLAQGGLYASLYREQFTDRTTDPLDGAGDADDTGHVEASPPGVARP
ncbi:MAG: ABC transporter ATP-binding protein/permease [Dehalococcoidia bacterium]|nr:ABC transporter ATP-binding protein/permease [Dehalococcoidia bacterium]